MESLSIDIFFCIVGILFTEDHKSVPLKLYAALVQAHYNVSIL